MRGGRKKKEIAGKEELKRERDQLLKELEGLKRNKEPIATNELFEYVYFC